jgi:hypothetical protein
VVRRLKSSSCISMHRTANNTRATCLQLNWLQLKLKRPSPNKLLPG